MKNKKLLTSIAIAGTVVIGGGSFYAYNYFNNPLVKIASAEVETAENVQNYLKERHKEDLAWFDKNIKNDKNLKINIPTVNSSVDFYYDANKNESAISADIAFIPNENKSLTFNIRDKENNIVIDSSAIDYAVSIPSQVIKEYIKNSFESSPPSETTNQLKDTIDELEIKVHNIVETLFFTETYDETILSTSEKLDILKSIPENSITEDNGKYIVKLKSEDINNMLSKYEEIYLPKINSESKKKNFKNNLKSIKESITKNLKNEIIIEYEIKDNEVIRTIKANENNKNITLVISTKTSKDKLEFSYKDEDKPNKVAKFVTEKTGDKSYKDSAFEEDKLVFEGESTQSDKKISTTYKGYNDSQETSKISIISTYSDENINYDFKLDEQEVLKATYTNKAEKPKDVKENVKNLEGKSEQEQADILADFFQRLFVSVL